MTLEGLWHYWKLAPLRRQSKWYRYLEAHYILSMYSADFFKPQCRTKVLILDTLGVRKSSRGICTSTDRIWKGAIAWKTFKVASLFGRIITLMHFFLDNIVRYYIPYTERLYEG